MKKLLFIIFLIVFVVLGGIFLSRAFRGDSSRTGTVVLKEVRSAAAGFGHTLAVKSDRTVWTWGRNDLGQLGDGTTVDRTTAKQVAGIDGIVAVAAGDGHSMALSAEGSVLTWGGNEQGQLGIDGVSQRSLPGKVSGLLMVSAIAAGEGHSLALRSDGTVVAWGSNEFGQLGDGTKSGHSAFLPVTGLTGVSSLASGRNHVAVVIQDGTVRTWGANDSGQLGDGSTTDRSVPAPVGGLVNVIAVACGYDHTFALRSDGTVWAWGANDAGQLGDGTTEMRTRPVQVAGLEGVAALAAGHRHSLALLVNGDVKAWGSNFHYQLSRRYGNQRLLPDTIVSLGGAVTAIATGAYHALAIDGHGTLRSWGFNRYGQLGDASKDYRIVPVLAQALASAPSGTAQVAPSAPGAESIIVAIAAARSHSVALKGDGSVWTWGDNFHGQLGDGERRTIRPRPQKVPNMTLVKSVAAGNNITLALRQDGTVWAWGNNESNQLGDGSNAQNRAVPVQVPGLADVTAIAASNSISSALRSDGTVWTWGGVHGSIVTSPSATPVQMTGLGPIAAIAAGHTHMLALGKDGTVWGWGENHFAQLGDGTTVNQRTPVRVSGLTDVVAIAAGGKHSAALKKDGSVWAWGLVRRIATKDTLAACNAVPAVIEGFQDITAIAAGNSHTIALKRDGTVWGWGNNEQRQLGNYVPAMSDKVLQVARLSNVTKIAAGWDHNLALLKDGILMAWGDNSHGQTGDGSQWVQEEGSKSFNTGMLAKMAGPVAWSAPTATVPPPAKHTVKALSAGGTHSGLLMDDGSVWLWGDNTYQQLGRRSDVAVPGGKNFSAMFDLEKPCPAAGLSNIQAIDMGLFHSLALRNDGTVVQWGRNSDNLLHEQQVESLGFSARIQHDRSISSGRGNPMTAMQSGVVEQLTEVTAVSAGAGFSLALRRDGTVWAWGLNDYGQLGDGTTQSRKAPQQVPGVSGITAVVGGPNYALALASDGSVWGWGLTSYRKSGRDVVPHTETKPMRISGLPGAIAIAAAGEPLALMADGTLWSCWTWQREDPAAFGPAPIAGLEGIREISSETYYTLALGRSSVYAMRGYRTVGKDGNMTMVRQVEMVEEADDAAQVSAGGKHGLLLKRDGTLWAWGDNEFGQLGDKTSYNSMYPVLIRIP